MKRRFTSYSSHSLVQIVLVAFVLLAGSLFASAQSAGFDLFQTGSGSNVDLSSIGLGLVPLSGVPILSSLGNTDTMIHRTQSVPPGGGTVPTNVYALFMKSTSPVTFHGQSADVYVTINNSGGAISTGVLPQPDSLAGSNGSVTVTVGSGGGTFNSTLTVNADVIFVKAGTSVTNPANYLGHQPAPPVTLTSTNATWSTSPPSGYPSSPSYPSGGFYPIKVPHTAPSHLHNVVPAACPPAGGVGAQIAIKVCAVAVQQ